MFKRLKSHSSFFFVFLVFCFFYLSLFFLKPINLFTADLGRHLINGREIIASLPQRSPVFDTNYFSYTYPDYPFMNHHWLFGVLAWGWYRLFGFVGLQLMNASLKALAVVLMLGGVMFFSRQRGRFFAGAVALALVLPLVTARVEVRPETFSLLSLAVFYLSFLSFSKGKLKFWQMMALLLPLEIVWVNMHIFWFFSFVVWGAFFIHHLIEKKWQELKQLAAAGFLMAVTTLVNPFTWHLSLYPTQILKNYGYQIAENQTILFMIRRFGWPIYYYTVALALGLMVLVFLNFYLKKIKLNWHDLILAGVFLLASFKLNRLLPFLGLMLLVIFFQFGRWLFEFVKQHNYFVSLLSRKLYLVPLLTIIGFVSFLGVVASGLWLPPLTQLYLGTLPQTFSLANFLKENQVAGPIFNNYDLGGYLIFNLFPNKRVFVDNRPEAYPVKFLQAEYVKAQESEEVWRQVLDRYQFQAIVFYRLDQTPWAQPFLIKRLKDPDWTPVYVDAYSIVFLKKTNKNQSLIKKFALPAEIFAVNKDTKN